MRILLATRTFATVTHGPARFARFVARLPELDAAHEVRVLTEDAPGDADSVQIYPLQVRYPPQLEAFNKFFRMAAYHRAARQIYREFPFDVLLYNDAVQGLLSAWRFPAPVKVVGMLNDSSYLHSEPLPGQPWRKWLIRRLYRWAESRFVHAADLTITCSDWLKAKVESEYGVRGKVRRLYQAVDLSQWPFTDRSDTLSSPIRLLFLKSDPWIGGLDVLLQALQNLPNYRFELIAAGFDPSLSTHYRHALTHLPHVDVRWPGALATEAVQRQLRRADLFCVPSRYEGLGVAHLEALAGGVPVVTTTAEGLPEVMDQGRNGWSARPADAADLARQLRACITSPDERRRRSIAGRRYVEEYFQYEGMLRRLVEILARAGV